MQQEGTISVKCSKHDEEIIAFFETQEKCWKCLIENHVSRDELSKQIEVFRKKKIANLNQGSSISEKKLVEFRKIFTQIKESFQKRLKDVENQITARITEMQKSVQILINELQIPLERLNSSQIKSYITKLQKQYPENDDFINSDNQFMHDIEREYKVILTQLNDETQQRNISQPNEQVNPQKKVKIEKAQQFKKTKEILIGGYCFAIAVNNTLLIHGEDESNIKLWNIEYDLKERIILQEHSKRIISLCFGHDGQWFISCSWDEIKIWENRNNQWICKQTLEVVHSTPSICIFGVILTKEEDQFITCDGENYPPNSSTRIRIWMNCNDSWKQVQLLNLDCGPVRFLSLNPDSTLFASTDDEALRIWRKENQKWEQGQVLNNRRNEDHHLRVQFIDSQLIATSVKSGNVVLYEKQADSFKFKTEIKLPNSIDEPPFYFPMLYNKILGFLVVRQSSKRTFILKKEGNCNFQEHQTLEGDYQAGCFSQDGRLLFLIHTKDNSNLLEIFK